MVDEQLLREHINSYPLYWGHDTFVAFREKLCAAPKEKLSSKKRNILVHIEATDYPFNGIKAMITAKINKIPCSLSFSTNYDKFKRGITLYVTYNKIKFQPFVMPFATSGDESNITYQTVIPFMIWMSEEDRYTSPFCREDYQALVENDTQRIELIRSVEGGEYIENIEKYFSSSRAQRFDTVFEARIAATKMFDRLIEYMEEIAWEDEESCEDNENE